MCDHNIKSLLIMSRSVKCCMYVDYDYTYTFNLCPNFVSK
jgi:hypothetical protein